MMSSVTSGIVIKTSWSTKVPWSFSTTPLILKRPSTNSSGKQKSSQTLSRLNPSFSNSYFLLMFEHTTNVTNISNVLHWATYQVKTNTVESVADMVISQVNVHTFPHFEVVLFISSSVTGSCNMIMPYFNASFLYFFLFFNVSVPAAKDETFLYML